MIPRFTPIVAAVRPLQQGPFAFAPSAWATLFHPARIQCKHRESLQSTKTRATSGALLVPASTRIAWGLQGCTIQERLKAGGIAREQISSDLRFFLSHFPPGLAAKNLSAKRNSFLLKEKSSWKRITSGAQSSLTSLNQKDWPVIKD